MFGNLINKKVLLELYEGLENKGFMVPVDVVIQNIKDMPIVSGWIPCSERLPDHGNKVLVWYKGERFYDFTEFSEYAIARYRKESGDWSGEFFPDVLDVIAWMPLPEPYDECDISDRTCTYEETGCGSCELQTRCPNDQTMVDATPVVHGKWLISCDGYYPYCSVCKTEPVGGKMTKYCPECGTKMDGDKNEK